MRWIEPTIRLHAALAALCVAMLAPVAMAQAMPTQSATAAEPPAACPDSLATYDVVLVKPFDMNQKMVMRGLQYTPDGMHSAGPLAILIRLAYGGFRLLPTEDSVIGLPDWGKSQMFTVDAKMSPEQTAAFAKLDKDQQQACRNATLQAILADRFQLKIHREPKQVPDYELVVAKGGPKMKEADAPNPNSPKGPDGKPITGSFLMMRKNGQVTAQQFTMESLASLGDGLLGVGRMVVDKTGLTGKYNFTLNWTPDAGMGTDSVDGIPKGAAADDNAPSIFTALQEQLGLKLVPGTGTIDAVVVDHVEKPTED